MLCYYILYCQGQRHALHGSIVHNYAETEYGKDYTACSYVYANLMTASTVVSPDVYRLCYHVSAGSIISIESTVYDYIIGYIK